MSPLYLLGMAVAKGKGLGFRGKYVVKKDLLSSLLLRILFPSHFRHLPLKKTTQPIKISLLFSLL